MAATQKKQIKLVMSYEYSDQYRSYTITRKNTAAYYPTDLKTRINALNANMPEYFKQTFISDEYDPAIKIIEAQYIETDEEIIYGHQ